MKNIHLIPTEQQSKLYIWEGKLRLGELTTAPKILGINNQFIYMTNSEVIKMDEPYLGEDNHIYYLCEGGVNSNGKKIVLTNNPRLIVDGVQELTEEQLKEIVSKYPLDYVEVSRIKDIRDDAWYNTALCRMVYSLSFSAENIINNWLDKNGTKEINKEVEMEAERYNKLVSDFENMEGIIVSMFDAKDRIKFERFVERQEKEDLGYTTKLGIEVPNEMVRATMIPKQYFGEKETKQQGKELTTEEVMEGRSSAYNFLDFNSREKDLKIEKLYTEEELFNMTLEAISIGMVLRQDQLNGWSDESGNDIHKEWFEKIKK